MSTTTFGSATCGVHRMYDVACLIHKTHTLDHVTEFFNQAKAMMMIFCPSVGLTLHLFWNVPFTHLASSISSFYSYIHLPP